MLRLLLLLASACAARAVPLSSTLRTLREDLDALEAITGSDHERRRPGTCERMAGDHFDSVHRSTGETVSLWTSPSTRCSTCVSNDGVCQLCVRLASWNDMKCLETTAHGAGCDSSLGYYLLTDPDCHDAHLQMQLMDEASELRVRAWMGAAEAASQSTKLSDYAFAFLDIDGVLNRMAASRNANIGYPDHTPEDRQGDPLAELVMNLKSFKEKYEQAYTTAYPSGRDDDYASKVIFVLSSTWRIPEPKNVERRHTYEAVQTALTTTFGPGSNVLMGSTSSDMTFGTDRISECHKWLEDWLRGGTASKDRHGFISHPHVFLDDQAYYGHQSGNYMFVRFDSEALLQRAYPVGAAVMAAIDGLRKMSPNTPDQQTAAGFKEVKDSIGAYLDAAAERAQKAVDEMPSEVDRLERGLAERGVADFRTAKAEVGKYVDAQWKLLEHVHHEKESIRTLREDYTTKKKAHDDQHSFTSMFSDTKKREAEAAKSALDSAQEALNKAKSMADHPKLRYALRHAPNIDASYGLTSAIAERAAELLMYQMTGRGNEEDKSVNWLYGIDHVHDHWR